MEVVTLPLPPSLRSKLQAAGYSTIDSNVSPVELARDVCITHEEALGIIKLIPTSNVSPCGTGASSALDFCGQNAWDLFRHEKAKRRIITSCHDLDNILGGGICTKEVTEICGVPGVGKTQLGIQLAVNVQIPAELGGMGGHAIYIDTEGSFMVERAVQMIESSVVEIMRRAMLDPQVDMEALKSEVNVDKFLSQIYYFRIHDVSEQVAVINTLEKFMIEHGQIVLVNQVTNKITQEGSEVVPALGESWSHACTNRLILYWRDGQRFASLFKSPSLPTATAAYEVSAKGITDAFQTYKKAKYI